MANGRFDHTRTLFLAADIDWETDDFLLVGVDSTYTFDPTDTMLDDVPSGAILDTDAMTTAIVDGYADADDCSLTVAIGKTLTGLIIVHDTGDTATSELLVWMDTNTGDNTAINRPGTGTAFAINWPAAGIFRL